MANQQQLQQQASAGAVVGNNYMDASDLLAEALKQMDGLLAGW